MILKWYTKDSKRKVQVCLYANFNTVLLTSKTIKMKNQLTKLMGPVQANKSIRTLFYLWSMQREELQQQTNPM